ncbi:MAG: ferrous iron transport protein A [Candidatus Omnitrophota bacterium]|nr:MAG: ferrous iron transport protein A [Candidatus Omnitrophota bacterium]
MTVDITRLQPGESGTVAEIQGGLGFTRKIQGMGIRPGKRITKVSSHFWRGPQTIAIGNLKVAIGFGMAKRILVKVER